MSEKEHKLQLKALKVTTAKATKSKKSALAYLERSGILKIMEASHELESKDGNVKTSSH